VIDESQAVGADMQALLVGGSFLQVTDEEPRDIDCICFYTSNENIECASELNGIWQAAKKASVDIRFVPFDSDPLFVLKTCSFFTTLYSRTRDSSELSRGTLLVYNKKIEGRDNNETA